MILIVECSEYLWGDITCSHGDFYGSDESIFCIFCDICDICSGLLPIEIEHMCTLELANELEKYEILYSTLFQRPFTMDLSEDHREISEITEVELHVS